MRKQLLCAVALGLSAFALPAAAQDTDNILLQTSVSPHCQGSMVGLGSAMNVGDLTGAAGFVVTTFTGTTSASTTANYYCNAPARVTLSATPLLNPDVAEDPSSFVNRVDYTASLTWDNVAGSVSSAASAPVEILSAEANTGILTLAVSQPSVPSGDRPIAGSYSGVVTVNVALQ